MAREYRFSLRRLAPALLLVAILLVLANIVTIVYLANQAEPDVEAFRLLILDYEANIPTWFSVILLALAALLFRIHAGAAEKRDARYWNGFAILFVIMSLDECVSLHESVSDFVRPLGIGVGIFHFAWVIPALIWLVILGIIILPFVRRLPEPIRRRLVVSGAVYLLGAVGCEMIGGAWAERAGTMNVTYGIIMTFEETLEITGLWLLVRALSAEIDTVRVRLS